MIPSMRMWNPPATVSWARGRELRWEDRGLETRDDLWASVETHVNQQLVSFARHSTDAQALRSKRQPHAVRKTNRTIEQRPPLRRSARQVDLANPSIDVGKFAGDCVVRRFDDLLGDIAMQKTDLATITIGGGRAVDLDE